MPQITKKSKFKNLKPLLLTLNAILIVGLAVFGGYYFRKYQQLKNNPPSAEEVQKREQDRVITAVSKLYALPKDETPQLIFVKDKEKLSDAQKQQEIFQKSANGDYLLVYVKNKLAILYRDSEKRIVDVRSISVQNTVNLKIIGAEADRNALKTKLSQSNLKDRLNFKEEGVAKSQLSGLKIIDLSGNNVDLTKQIAENIKATVINQWPAGEDKPNDIEIVILSGSAAAPVTEQPPAP